MTRLGLPHRFAANEPVTVAGSVARSHVGRVRAINEDRVFDHPAAGLWAVADGMGGHSGGDVAAQATIDALRALVQSAEPIDAAAMVRALRSANRAIVERNQQRDSDAGSTVVALHAAAGVATVAWVGDSRAYLVRRGVVTQLTSDHSVVQELLDAGLLTPDAACRHPQANVITRALGIADPVEIATTALSLESGDRLLLCSDGLSRSLRTDDLAQGCAGVELADALMVAALERDGSDNTSLVTIAFTSSKASS